MIAIERVWYPRHTPSIGERLAWLPASALAWAFGIGVALKNALYDRGVLEPARIANAHVISVGNLNVGGAGKTPVVMFLANRFRRAGHRVAVLSRGYHRESTHPLAFDADALPSFREAGDEPVIIARHCPGVRVFVGADRIERAHAAVAAGYDLLLLDDGLQHRRLARDRDVVVIDEGDGLGNGWLLPRGPLREPPSALARASLIWLRASDRPAPLPPFSAPIVRARHAPSVLVDEEGVEHAATTLAGQKVHALCALARPWSFTRTLESLGAQVVGRTFRPDHQPWTREGIDRARREAARTGARIVTTEKDAVKLPADARLAVLRLEVQVLSGEEHLDRLLADPAESR